MFSDLEKKIIVMALMYLKSDYTRNDLDDLGLNYGQPVRRGKGNEFEKICDLLTEDLIGPTWDEEQTAVNIAEKQEQMTRPPCIHDFEGDDNQLKLFPEET